MRETFVFSLERMVTVMVITCPHALGLAIPLVVAVSTSLSAGYGLLIRNRGPFEAARNIQAIIFDKTGTLTKGTFEVAEVVTFSENMDKNQVLAKAAAVESRSEHPIAKAIASAVENPGEVAEFQAIKGKGARAKVDGTEVLVVSPGYLKENDIAVDQSRVQELSTGGRTVVFVVIGDEVKGAIALEDMVREESKEAMSKLKSLGVKTMMLTGDNEEVAKKVADEIGIDEYFAGVLPDKKAEKVKEVQSRGLVVAMVGDGVNDAPALAQANVGIAIGAGTDVAAETADIILVRNNPLDVIKLLQFSRATYKKMVQNLIYATGYNVVAIPLAAGVLYSVGILLSPAAGALLMSLSTVVVAINARFLRVPDAA
jgi:Cu2+-exporting ATPase